MDRPPPAPRVLLVEDDQASQLLFRQWLTRDGFHVSVVSDGEGALTVLSAESFDLILLDIRLAHLSGLEVARRLRAGGDTTPIVAVTANAFSQDREQCLAAGIDGYVSKPCPHAALFDEIAAVMANR